MGPGQLHISLPLGQGLFPHHLCSLALALFFMGQIAHRAEVTRDVTRVQTRNDLSSNFYVRELSLCS